MIRNISILAIILALIAAYTWYDGYRQNKNLQAAAQNWVGRQAPDFTFTTLEGVRHNLSDFKGEVIVLNFWATWCAPCVVEFPQLIDLARAQNDKLIVVFISVDADREAVDRFLKKYGRGLPRENVLIAMDSEKYIAQTIFDTPKLPETYIIDPSLRIKDKIIGNSVKWNGNEMHRKIESLYNPL